MAGSSVADGCTSRVPDDLADELPFLLWTVSLGLLYCWMHDHSEHQEKTRTILRRSVGLLAGLIRLSSVPGAGHFRRQLVAVLHPIRSSLPLAPTVLPDLTRPGRERPGSSGDPTDHPEERECASG